MKTRKIETNAQENKRHQPAVSLELALSWRLDSGNVPILLVTNLTRPNFALGAIPLFIARHGVRENVSGRDLRALGDLAVWSVAHSDWPTHKTVCRELGEEVRHLKDKDNQHQVSQCHWALCSPLPDLCAQMRLMRENSMKDSKMAAQLSLMVSDLFLKRSSSLSTLSGSYRTTPSREILSSPCCNSRSCESSSRPFSYRSL